MEVYHRGETVVYDPEDKSGRTTAMIIQVEGLVPMHMFAGTAGTNSPDDYSGFIKIPKDHYYIFPERGRPIIVPSTELSHLFGPGERVIHVPTGRRAVIIDEAWGLYSISFDDNNKKQNGVSPDDLSVAPADDVSTCSVQSAFVDTC